MHLVLQVLNQELINMIFKLILIYLVFHNIDQPLNELDKVSVVYNIKLQPNQVLIEIFIS